MEPVENLDIISNMMIHSDDIMGIWTQMENSIKSIMKGNCSKISVMLMNSHIL